MVVDGAKVVVEVAVMVKLVVEGVTEKVMTLAIKLRRWTKKVTTALSPYVNPLKAVIVKKERREKPEEAQEEKTKDLELPMNGRQKRRWAKIDEEKKKERNT